MTKPRLHASTEAVLKTIMDTSARGTSTLSHMHNAFLFGMKVGAYLALRRVDLMTGCLSHEEIYCLGGTTEDILDQVEKAAEAGGGDIEAILKEKLQESMASQVHALGLIEKAQEAMDEARICHEVFCRETKILEGMMKELVGDKKP